MDYMDIVSLLKYHDYDDVVSSTVADYLTSCIEYTLDLNEYIWNTLLFNVQIFDTKEEAKNYIIENLTCPIDDCVIYKANNGKVYLEY